MNRVIETQNTRRNRRRSFLFDANRKYRINSVVQNIVDFTSIHYTVHITYIAIASSIQFSIYYTMHEYKYIRLLYTISLCLSFVRKIVKFFRFSFFLLVSLSVFLFLFDFLLHKYFTWLRVFWVVCDRFVHTINRFKEIDLLWICKQRKKNSRINIETWNIELNAEEVNVAYWSQLRY